MSHSICGINIPDGLVSVSLEDSGIPTAPTILCLIGIYGREWAAIAQAKALEALLDGGIKLVCLDEAAGMDAVPTTMHPRVADALHQSRERHPEINVQGVDDLNLVAEMREVQRVAKADEEENVKVLKNCASLLLESVHRLAGSDAATFLVGTHAYHCGSGLGNYARMLLALEGKLGIPLPPDGRRMALAAAKNDSFNSADVKAEQKELLQRLEANVRHGVLHPAAVENIRVASRFAETGKDGNKVFRTREGSLILSKKDQQAQASIHDFLDGMPFGGLAFTMDEMQEYQARQQALGSNEEARQVYTQVERLNRVFSIAKLAAIEMGDFPCLLAGAEQANLLQPLANRNFTENLFVAIDLAGDSIEEGVCLKPEEKTLAVLLKRWRFLDRLARVEMTPAHYDALVADLENCRLGAILGGLPRGGSPVDSALLSAAECFDTRREIYRQFYCNARLRARRMAKAVLQQAQSLEVDKVLLLSLGFHVPTYKRIWEGHDCGYVIFHPKPGPGDSLDPAQ